MKHLALGIACATATITFAGAAAAEPARAPAVVALITPRCDRSAFDREAFARLFRIELHADGVTEVRRAEAAPRTPEPSLAIVSIEGGCGDDPAVTVIIDDAATDKAVRRVIALGDVPAVARPRALALAAAELLRASWAELLLPDAPKPRAEVPPAVRASTAARIAEALPPSRVEPARSAPATPMDLGGSRFISAGIDGRIFFGGHVAMLGARGGASVPVVGPLRVRAEIGGWAGGAEDALGRIQLTLVTGTVGLGVAVVSRPRVGVDVGSDLEIGWARATGNPRLTTTAVLGGSSWMSSGSLVATSRIRIAGRLWATADVRLGAVFKGLTATADGREAAGISGALGGARLGLALGL